MYLRTRHTCIFLILSWLTLTTIGCKKTAGPNGQTSDTNTNIGHVPGQGDKVVIDKGVSGPITSFNYSQHDVDSLLTTPAASHAASLRPALDYWTSEPPKIAIAPYLLPVTNIVSISETDSSGLFSAEAGHAPMSMIVTLRKKRSANNSIWLVTRIEEAGRNDQSKPAAR